MEKNVPLLKLIHDPWSIKTMLSSRFTSVPLRPRAPTHGSKPGGRGGGGGIKRRRGRGWREGYSFLSGIPRASGCFVVVFQSRSCGKVLVLSRLWEFSLIPNGKNRIDRSPKSPREGGGYIRLFPSGPGRGDAAPPPSFLLRWLLSPTGFPILPLCLQNLNAAL